MLVNLVLFLYSRVEGEAGLSLQHLVDQLGGQVQEVRGGEAVPVRGDELRAVLLQPATQTVSYTSQSISTEHMNGP
jgi:hypothetical protein